MPLMRFSASPMWKVKEIVTRWKVNTTHLLLKDDKSCVLAEAIVDVLLQYILLQFDNGIS